MSANQIVRNITQGIARLSQNPRFHENITQEYFIPETTKKDECIKKEPPTVRKEIFDSSSNQMNDDDDWFAKWG